jgi:signal transduction histidine kinase
MATRSWPIRSSSRKIHRRDPGRVAPPVGMRTNKVRPQGQEAMEVRSTPSSPRVEGQEIARFLIDQGELRSILSNLSHELCRPLVSLRAGFDLLLGDSPSNITPDQQGHLLTMVSLCDDLLRLTRSYLDYAGIVQGSRPLCLGSFTIGALIDELNRQFAPVAQSRQLVWESRAQAPEMVVVTDASRCQQIFGNLVSNAIKYTPVGGQVRVAGKVDTDSWTVVVADSGPGIPAEALDRVFEPFFRLDRDEHSIIEGSGLGLAICRELVAQMQGDISVDSVAGKGTSICVRFPMNAAGPTQSSSLAENAAAARRDRTTSASADGSSVLAANVDRTSKKFGQATGRPVVHPGRTEA